MYSFRPTYSLCVRANGSCVPSHGTHLCHPPPWRSRDVSRSSVLSKKESKRCVVMPFSHRGDALPWAFTHMHSNLFCCWKTQAARAKSPNISTLHSTLACSLSGWRARVELALSYVSALPSLTRTCLPPLSSMHSLLHPHLKIAFKSGARVHCWPTTGVLPNSRQQRTCLMCGGSGVGATRPQRMWARLPK